MGASAPGKQGGLYVAGYFPELGGISPIPTPRNLTRTRTLHVSTPDNAKWDIAFQQDGTPGEEGTAPTESFHTFDEPRAFKGEPRTRRASTRAYWARASVQPRASPGTATR
ncbi:hypothetical protein [Streptomyces sp. NPDC050982]|uniref:hypothetical protein n=1 Tax=Streptomyces sp. NPDC050982 TaxID=3154746 RepID=UPI0033FD34D0